MAKQKDYSKLTLTQLASEYNSIGALIEKQTGDIIPTVNKFSDRESGIRRTTELAAQLPNLNVEQNVKKSGRGRPSKNSGKKIFPIVDGNPRLAGSHGYHAFKIVQENPGILYEDYIANGGGSHHLRWDLARKFVEVR